MKPICTPCRRFYRPKKNGIYFVEGMPQGDSWVPYKLWMGDLWSCPGCSSEIIVGTGFHPVAVHHEPDFAKLVAQLGSGIRIDDC